MHQQTRQAFPNHSLTHCVQSEEHNLVQSSQIIFQGHSSPRKKLNFSVKLSRRRRLFISRLNVLSVSFSLSQESVRRILIHSHTFSLSKFVLPIFLLLVALLSLSTLLNFFTTYLPPCVSFINVKVFLVPVLSFLLHLLPFPSIYYTHNFSLSNTHTHPCTFFFQHTYLHPRRLSVSQTLIFMSPNLIPFSFTLCLSVTQSYYLGTNIFVSPILHTNIYIPICVYIYVPTCIYLHTFISILLFVLLSLSLGDVLRSVKNST